jgi:hypothetical protein
MTREHHHEIEIDATADQVWRSITDGDELPAGCVIRDPSGAVLALMQNPEP